MDIPSEREATTLRAARDGPTRQRARHVDHILLRVAAVYAQRVQLHQLSRVVLVQTTSTRRCLLQWLQWRVLRDTLRHGCRATGRLTRIQRARCRTQRGTATVGHTLPVVQVVEHGRALGHGAE